MAIVRAAVKPAGSKSGYIASNVLIDTGARTTPIDRSLAEHLGVEYTGRRLGLISTSGHRVEALEALILELVLEGSEVQSCRSCGDP